CTRIAFGDHQMEKWFDVW
nr:immunoglobulin heavy chain junction region [Macaca mulatta]MOW22621.1 immunoglobulin heavy chain junction region [Macaca mulatta]MOW22675.1 immunoglobulin heavy chain junction region [Macaca mulatta]MOW22788.1 immunoglobulin heavy chain junction region [Macaca mulatta]MOW22848.1 immunoglobulin heavy chain junction region [Macaca mulatta]